MTPQTRNITIGINSWIRACVKYFWFVSRLILVDRKTKSADNIVAAAAAADFFLSPCQNRNRCHYLKKERKNEWIWVCVYVQYCRMPFHIHVFFIYFFLRSPQSNSWLWNKNLPKILFLFNHSIYIELIQFIWIQWTFRYNFIHCVIVCCVFARNDHRNF